MLPAKKNESDYTAVVIDFKTRKIAQKPINSLQNEKQEKSCFRSNHSYYCTENECSSWNECKKLVAAWMR